MIFVHQTWLWALALPAACALALVVMLFLGRRARTPRWPAVVRVLASGGRIRPIKPSASIRRPWFILLALACGLVALARPQWGTIEEPVRENAREVMLALDLSRSMLVEDVPPNRLERARLLLRSLLDSLKGERVGLTVFAGTAFVQVPLSADYEILGEFLPELNPAYMPQGGTDYTGMLHAALEGFSKTADTDRFLIILSDGESQTEDWRKHIAALRDRDVRVITLGVGTTKGGFIPDPKTGFAKDNRGAVVLSKLEPATLQALAHETEGVYRDASNWVDLPALLRQTVAQGRAGAVIEKKSLRHIERFQWFLAPAILLGLLGLWREPAVRARPQAIRPQVDPTNSVMPAPSLPRARAGAAAIAVGCLLAMWVTQPRLVALDLVPQMKDFPMPGGAAQDPAAAAAKVRETVSRLANQPNVDARGWHDLAHATLDWGRPIKASGQQVDEGPVRDALAGVDLGEKAAPLIADWKQLRAELEDLLAKPEQQQQQQNQDDKKDEKDQQKQQDQQQGQDNSQQQDQKQQDQQKSDDSKQNEQKQEQQQQDSQDPQQNSSESKDGSKNEPPSSQQQQDNQQEPKQDQQPRPEGGRLGDMKDEPPPPEPEEPAEQQQQPKTRKIAGRPSTELPPESVSPENAAALQQLRKATDKDSPARLFQLIEGTDPKPEQKGPDW